MPQCDSNPSQKPIPLAGFLILDKPAGISSMKVVAIVRRRAGGIKTGHAGTLDPLATGVLVLGLGKGTKHLQTLMDTDKRYHTIIDLSAFTNTDDMEGEREKIDLPDPLPHENAIDAALKNFRGDIMQSPPAFSAVKIGGRRAYKMARKGQSVAIPPRQVSVHGIELLHYEWPRVEVAIHCAKGFYVRSLARDLGMALGTGGHCVSIRRTAVGPFVIENAITLEDVPQPLGQTDLLTIDLGLEMVRQGDGGA